MMSGAGGLATRHSAISPATGGAAWDHRDDGVNGCPSMNRAAATLPLGDHMDSFSAIFRIWTPWTREAPPRMAFTT